MNFRHEWKHEINVSDLITLRQRLRAVAYPDRYTVDGKYEIRSLYFDNLADKALREKLDGVNQREKFRIRYYNRDPSLIRLEKKSKFGGIGSKQSAALTEEETLDILKGSYTYLKHRAEPVLIEFYSKIMSQQLRPKTVVDYTREPYLFPAGNVRVTIDYNIRTGLLSTDFLNPECITVPAGIAPIILEVKWDAYLPDLIRDVIQLSGCRTCSFSKYAACRVYG